MKKKSKRIATSKCRNGDVEPEFEKSRESGEISTEHVRQTQSSGKKPVKRFEDRPHQPVSLQLW